LLPLSALFDGSVPQVVPLTATRARDLRWSVPAVNPTGSGGQVARLRRIIRRQPAVNFTGALLLSYAFLWAFFGHRPKWFTRGDEVGHLAYDLSVGYSAAWMFNFLVIALPEQRAWERFHEVVLPRIDHLARPGLQLRQRILENVPEVDLNLDVETPVTEDQIRTWAQDKDWNSPAPVVTALGPDGSPVFQTWAQYAQIMLAQPTWLARLELAPYFLKLPEDVLQTVEAISHADLLTMARAFPVDTVVRGAVADHAPSIKRYIDACQNLRATIRHHSDT
jgi:hypothetical protein